MAPGFREENFELPSNDAITPVEVPVFSSDVRRGMAHVTEVLAGSSTEPTDEITDWSDPADHYTYGKPLTQGEL